MSHGHSHERIAVVSLGNSLAGDDGAGALVIEELRRRGVGRSVSFFYGGVSGLNIVYALEDFDAAIFVDAVSGLQAPGDIVRLEGEALFGEVATGEARISLHDISFADVLAFAKIVGLALPHHLILWAVQARSLERGHEVSSEVLNVISQLANNVEAEVRALRR